MRILLVEDDATTVESVKLCLEIYEPGSIIDNTNKGEEALAMLKESAYDCVLVDLGLPDIDGTEVLKKLRIFSKIPVIVISARQDNMVVSTTLALGADDYITKPFDYHQLLKSLNQLTQHASR
jgi:DNA-binding response OmpR family regulator